MLAQNIVLLCLSLIDHDSQDAHYILEMDEDGLIDLICQPVSVASHSQEDRHDQAQTNSLLGALLALSGYTLSTFQLGFAAEYTINRNADLLASLLQVKRTKHFGDWDSYAVGGIVSTSPVFSGKGYGSGELENWIQHVVSHLPIGFSRGYLVRIYDLRCMMLMRLESTLGDIEQVWCWTYGKL